MLIRPLFKKYQKQILDFANSDYGKRHLGIDTDKKIVKFTPDSYHELLGIKDGVATLRATFYSKSPYLKTFELPLTALEIAREANVYPKQLIKKPSDFVRHPYLSFLTLTSNPDANPESTSMDGYVRYDSSGVSWATAVGAGTGDQAGDSNPNFPNAASYYDTGSSRAQIYRSMFLFDTSSLTSGATISSAVFSLYGNSTQYDDDNDANGYTVLLTCTPASNTAIATTDFGSFGSTANSSTIDNGLFSSAGYNDYTLNATGLSNISKTGVSKFAVREGHDLNSDQPATTTNNGTQVFFSDNGSNKPKLVVTYTLAVAGGMFAFF